MHLKSFSERRKILGVSRNGPLLQKYSNKAARSVSTNLLVNVPKANKSNLQGSNF